MKVGRLFCILNALSTVFCKHCCGETVESAGCEEGGGYQVPGSDVAHIELFCASCYIDENWVSATSLQMAGQPSVGGCELRKS